MKWATPWYIHHTHSIIPYNFLLAIIKIFFVSTKEMTKENLIKRATLSCNHTISLETRVISHTSIGRMIFRNDPIVINQSRHDTTVCWHCQAHARFTSRILELKIVNLCIKKKWSSHYISYYKQHKKRSRCRHLGKLKLVHITPPNVDKEKQVKIFYHKMN